MLAQQGTIGLASHDMLHVEASGSSYSSEDIEIHAFQIALRLAAASPASSPPSFGHDAIIWDESLRHLSLLSGPIACA